MIESVAREAPKFSSTPVSLVGAPRLTLVTCGGEFDYENRRYLSNLVVTATPVT